jgi:hypothetical protein
MISFDLVVSKVYHFEMKVCRSGMKAYRFGMKYQSQTDVALYPLIRAWNGFY